MSEYKKLLWREVAVNDPLMAKAIKATQPFNPTLHMFRWLKPPKVVLCKWERKQ